MVTFSSASENSFDRQRFPGLKGRLSALLGYRACLVRQVEIATPYGTNADAAGN
jgi:hypothetical protein